MECPERDLEDIGKADLFDHEEPDMVYDENQSGEIKENHPEEELPEQWEKDLLYHKSKNQIYKISWKTAI